MIAFYPGSDGAERQGGEIRTASDAKPAKAAEIAIPDAFAEQLSHHPQANEVFKSKLPSFRKEYVVWIADAKTDQTRQKRIDESLEWITLGKGRFWKYEKK